MAHDVFISHSSKDKQIADAMCNKLESSGIRCWIAPRDILPGRKWSEAIVQAIGESGLMLLIFSTSANTSDHIEREVEIAANKRKLILPFRVEDVEPSGALEYYLRTPHWLDALTPPMEKHLNQLVESVRQLLQMPLRTTLAESARQLLLTLAHQTPPAPPARETPFRAAEDFPRILKNQVGIELVYVPAGSFMMGSENGMLNERPVHPVTIREGFYMGKYEVTQMQWQQVMGNNPSHFKGDILPVEKVSWADAQEFIQKLNAMDDGFIYRLPSEAEWEYACRAGTTEDYAGHLDSMAWYGNNSGREYLDAAEIWRMDRTLERFWSSLDAREAFERSRMDPNSYENRIINNGGQTHSVGQKQPNAFGLYDMHGNVWEWCQDDYHPNYNGAPTDGSAWLKEEGSSSRALRGGSWDSPPDFLRSANRHRVLTIFRKTSQFHGLRLVAAAMVA